MKIIEPSVTLYGPVPTTPAEAIKFIEQCGRLCYKSEDKITDTSAEPFVERLVKAGHLAMVEHSNFVVRLPVEFEQNILDEFEHVAGKFMTVVCDENFVYVGGNLTAWYQRIQAIKYYPMWMPFLWVPFLKEFGKLFGVSSDAYSDAWQVCPHEEIPSELHRYSARFICDRGVTHELVRHRPCSFAQESTRYVNYGGKDMEFIEPWWWEDAKEYHKQVFRAQCLQAELAYGYFLAEGHKAQAARAVLPNALKTEIIVTADAAEWRHIFKLRTALDAHPDMRRVMIPLREEFKQKYPEAFE